MEIFCKPPLHKLNIPLIQYMFGQLVFPSHEIYSSFLLDQTFQSWCLGRFHYSRSLRCRHKFTKTAKRACKFVIMMCSTLEHISLTKLTRMKIKSWTSYKLTSWREETQLEEKDCQKVERKVAEIWREKAFSIQKFIFYVTKHLCSLGSLVLKPLRNIFYGCCYCCWFCKSSARYLSTFSDCVEGKFGFNDSLSMWNSFSDNKCAD